MYLLYNSNFVPTSVTIFTEQPTRKSLQCSNKHINVPDVWMTEHKTMKAFFSIPNIAYVILNLNVCVSVVIYGRAALSTCYPAFIGSHYNFRFSAAATVARYLSFFECGDIYCWNRYFAQRLFIS